VNCGRKPTRARRRFSGHRGKGAHRTRCTSTAIGVANAAMSGLVQPSLEMAPVWQRNWESALVGRSGVHSTNYPSPETPLNAHDVRSG
jgi:hypothetical protein